MALAARTFDLEALRARRGADVRGQIFLGILYLSVAIAFGMVAAVFWDVIVGAWDIITAGLWNFMTSPSSSDPSKAGVAQGIRGSVIIAMIVMMTFPIGIAAAVYLEEYADDTWTSRLIQVTVRNLAGVPSIGAEAKCRLYRASRYPEARDPASSRHALNELLRRSPPSLPDNFRPSEFPE